MKTIVHQLFFFFLHLGGPGLLALGLLDSSFLFMPLGNDLLVIAMTSSKHMLMPYYAVMAAAGSVLGCLVLDLISRKQGEKGIEKLLPAKRLQYVKKRVKSNAGWALAFASLMPPPFPFTPFVIASAALQYPRKRLLAVIAAARLVRFSIEGALAILIGEKIIAFGKSPVVVWGVLALVVLSVAGSAISVYEWVKRSRKAA
ncbi:MAG TPA: hypothetical protein VFZ08_10770 [Terriglobia bacterium]|nr:hypothetical protein [Terriglobia bacterium]